MEAFIFSNIFATKGLEYLVIIAFLILLVPFWIMVNRRITVKSEARELAYSFKRIFQLPQPGMLYFKNHTWAFLDKSGLAKIGMGQFITRLIGEFSIDPVVYAGARVNKGDIIAELHQNGKSLRIKSPVSGEIQAINPSLIKNPGMISEDPGGDGWLFSLKPEDWKSDTSNIFPLKEAKIWISEELQRLRDFLAEALKENSEKLTPVVLQEGGELRPGILSDFNENTWQGFQENFLDEK